MNRRFREKLEVRLRALSDLHHFLGETEQELRRTVGHHVGAGHGLDAERKRDVVGKLGNRGNPRGEPEP